MVGASEASKARDKLTKEIRESESLVCMIRFFEFSSRGFKSGVWRPRGMEKRFDLTGRKFFHGAEWDAFQAQAADLVAAKAFYLIAELREEQSDLPFLSMMHVNIEIRGVVAQPGIDQRSSLDFESFTFHDEAFHQQRETLCRERFFQNYVVTFYH